MAIKLTMQEALEAKTERIPFSTCWYYIGNDANQFGHGRISFGGKREGAHRAAWLIKHGEIPKGMHVLHKCDEPSCLNPDHLFLGTQADNMKDKAKKKRCADRHGEKHPLSKLTPELVIWIRESPQLQREIAHALGTDQGTISNIINRKSWSHI